MVADSFQEIYREHFRFVWRSLQRLGVEPASLDDAAQDVFLVVYKRLDEFEGRSQLKTWIFGIALKVAHRHFQKRARLLRVPAEQEHEREAPPTPLETVAKKDAVRLLDELLASIDSTRRPIFVLAELEGFTTAEIAEALGIKLNTVSSRLRKARRELEGALARYRAREQRSES